MRIAFKGDHNGLVGGGVVGRTELGVGERAVVGCDSGRLEDAGCVRVAATIGELSRWGCDRRGWVERGTAGMMDERRVDHPS